MCHTKREAVSCSLLALRLPDACASDEVRRTDCDVAVMSCSLVFLFPLPTLHCLTPVGGLPFKLAPWIPLASLQTLSIIFTTPFPSDISPIPIPFTHMVKCVYNCSSLHCRFLSLSSIAHEFHVLGFSFALSRRYDMLLWMNACTSPL